MRSLYLAVLLALTAAPAWAMGPIDGEAGLVYWKNTQTLDANGSSVDFDGDAPGAHAEIWLLGRWGFRGSYWRSSVDSGRSTGDLDYINAELAYKLVKPTDNTFLSVGLGWQQAEFGDVDSGGVRASVHGRIGFLGFAYAYGQLGWAPSMSDFDVFRDVSSKDVELGVSFEPMPFLSLRAGYRVQRLEFSVAGPDNAELETKGVFAGAGVHW